jgi:hypothetical protein
MISENRTEMRERVSALLLSDGLQTRQTPVPRNSQEASSIEADLMNSVTLEDKLVIAGYSAVAHGERRCAECMYYQVKSHWCVLPAINLPAEPDWWCRLWRI